MKILKSRLDHINKYIMKNNFLILTTMLIFFGVYSQERIITADTSKVTKHSTIILNKKVNYSAQIGTQPIWDVDGEVIATLHYTYYKRTDIDDTSNRPLIFSFNGGPGSASIWMHMGYTGPYNLIIDDEGYPIQPYGYKSNPYSILDVADIVFVNPINIGYSRILKKMSKKEAASKFFGVNQDAKYLAEWITTFVNRSKRWKSPKYLVGESYGGVRVMGLAHELQQNQWMYLNGVVLVSPADYELDYESGGIILPTVDFPYFTATAWYHNKLNSEFQNKSLNEVIKNGFNWHMIDFLYEKGAIHYLISHNDILNEPDDEFFMALKLRYKRLIDNGMYEKDAQEECKNELKYANDVILKACEEDKEGLGKLGYEITNKGNHGIHHYLIKKPIGEYSLKLIVKEFKN